MLAIHCVHCTPATHVARSSHFGIRWSLSQPYVCTALRLYWGSYNEDKEKTPKNILPLNSAVLVYGYLLVFSTLIIHLLAILYPGRALLRTMTWLYSAFSLVYDMDQWSHISHDFWEISINPNSTKLNFHQHQTGHCIRNILRRTSAISQINGVAPLRTTFTALR